MDDTLTRDRDSWQPLFEELSQGRHGQSLSIEVLDDELGDQLEADRMPFDSLSYDPSGDVIVVSAGDRRQAERVVLRHVVSGPTTIDLLEQADERLVLRIVDRRQVATLLTFQP